MNVHAALNFYKDVPGLSKMGFVLEKVHRIPENTEWYQVSKRFENGFQSLRDADYLNLFDISKNSIAYNENNNEDDRFREFRNSLEDKEGKVIFAARTHDTLNDCFILDMNRRKKEVFDSCRNLYFNLNNEVLLSFKIGMDVAFTSATPMTPAVTRMTGKIIGIIPNAGNISTTISKHEEWNCFLKNDYEAARNYIDEDAHDDIDIYDDDDDDDSNDNDNDGNDEARIVDVNVDQNGDLFFEDNGNEDIEVNDDEEPNQVPFDLNPFLKDLPAAPDGLLISLNLSRAKCDEYENFLLQGNVSGYNFSKYDAVMYVGKGNLSSASIKQHMSLYKKNGKKKKKKPVKTDPMRQYELALKKGQGSYALQAYGLCAANYSTFANTQGGTLDRRNH